MTEVRRRLRKATPDLVQFAAELIRIPSENPPGDAYARCGKLIAAWQSELGLSVRTVSPHRGAPCILGTYGDGGRALYLSGHYDVVPAQARSQFAPAVRHGNLHGRGAADMKGGIAAMTFAIRALMEAGFEPAGRLVAVAVPDEETSGPRGTVALAKAGWLERDAIGMLTMEPTSGAVWHASRGVISLFVTVKGKASHVGLHFRGVNAFTGMLDVAARYRALGRRVAQRRTAHHIAPEAARRSVLLLGGALSGGHNFNVVPDRVSFTIDRRINPEEDLDAERAALLAIADDARARGIDCRAEITQEGHAASTHPRTDLGRALGTAIAAVTGRRARFELCPGVVETRHYAALGIPAFAYGPGLLSVAHGAHEFVSVKKLVESAEVYARTAAVLLG